MKASRMKFLQYASHLLPRLAVAVCIATAASALGGCALNPFGTKEVAEENASPVAAGVVQTMQEKKLFGVLPVYRPDVQQGNFVSKEMVSQLKVGMTPEQVRFLLGSPLVTDIFHGERWDYPFRMRKGNGQITASRVSVFFKEGRVERFEGGDLPDEKDYLQRLAAPKK